MIHRRPPVGPGNAAPRRVFFGQIRPDDREGLRKVAPLPQVLAQRHRHPDQAVESAATNGDRLAGRARALRHVTARRAPAATRYSRSRHRRDCRSARRISGIADRLSRKPRAGPDESRQAARRENSNDVLHVRPVRTTVASAPARSPQPATTAIAPVVSGVPSAAGPAAPESPASQRPAGATAGAAMRIRWRVSRLTASAFRGRPALSQQHMRAALGQFVAAAARRHQVKAGLLEIPDRRVETHEVVSAPPSPGKYSMVSISCGGQPRARANAGPSIPAAFHTRQIASTAYVRARRPSLASPSPGAT